MGILSFLKKKKESDFSLDLPPPPDVPPLPDLDLADIPEIRHETEEKPLPSFDFKSELNKLREEQELPAPKKLRRPAQTPKIPSWDLYEEPLPNFEIDKPRLDFNKPLYIRVEKLKEILDSVTTARSSLNLSEEILFGLDSTEAEKEKLFTAWQNCLEDTQRKLIFIDKTIFKE